MQIDYELEKQILFTTYGITGYTTGSTWMRGGATPEYECQHTGENSGDTQGHLCSEEFFHKGLYVRHAFRKCVGFFMKIY